MPENYFMSDAFVPAAPSLHDALQSPAERILWSGRCAVAEYAFDEPASLPRWTLPEETEVVITEERVVYRDPVSLETGELRWQWPQHLRVQPGNRDIGRSATVTQIQLVCAGPGNTFPALVFAGGDLNTVGDADRLANVLRQAIARYRVEHANALGIPAAQVRMLSRLVIGPEFSNYQGGEGQTVSLLGAVAVADSRPGYAEVRSVPPAAPATIPAAATPLSATDPVAAAASLPVAGAMPVVGSAPTGRSTYPVAPVSGGGQTTVPIAGGHPAPAVGGYPVSADDGYPAPSAGTYPGRSAAAVGGYPAPAGSHERSTWGARPADEIAPTGRDLDSRAADLAARVADLVSGGLDFGGRPVDDFESQTNLSAYLDVPAPAAEPRSASQETTEALDRAETVRRTAARFAGNAARVRGAAPRYDGASGGGHRQG